MTAFKNFLFFSTSLNLLVVYDVCGFPLQCSATLKYRLLWQKKKKKRKTPLTPLQANPQKYHSERELPAPGAFSMTDNGKLL